MEKQTHQKNHPQALECPPGKLFSLAGEIKAKEPSMILLDILCIDTQKSPRFKLIYRFLDMRRHLRPCLVVRACENTTLHGLSPLWANAGPYEMEIADLFGLEFTDSHPKYFTKNLLKAPLRKDFSPPKENRETTKAVEGEGISWYPTYPEYKGAMLFQLEIEEEVVRKSTAVPGFSHKGIEKMLEQTPYAKGVHLIERVNFIGRTINALTWVKAVEDLCEIEITEKAQALRMVFLELARVNSHLFSIIQMMIAFGLTSLNWPFASLKETVEELGRAYNGKRNFAGIAQIGGTEEVDLKWINKCMDVAKQMRQFLKLIESLCTREDGWMARLDHFKADPRFVFRWGLTGPILRASGLSYDLRKTSPIYFYDDVDFEVPLGLEGSGYDCYLVRIEEARQSIGIITQILDGLPSGKGMKEMEGFTIKSGSVYSFFEGPFGETGFYLESDGGENPYRARFRSPHYSALFSLDELFRQKSIGEIDDMLYSFGLSMEEVDR